MDAPIVSVLITVVSSVFHLFVVRGALITAIYSNSVFQKRGPISAGGPNAKLNLKAENRKPKSPTRNTKGWTVLVFLPQITLTLKKTPLSYALSSLLPGVTPARRLATSTTVKQAWPTSPSTRRHLCRMGWSLKIGRGRLEARSSLAVILLVVMRISPLSLFIHPRLRISCMKQWRRL